MDFKFEKYEDAINRCFAVYCAKTAYEASYSDMI